MLLAVLYCKATPRTRATKFYQLVQMDLTPHVGCCDKELQDYFRKILQLSSVFLTEIFETSFIALAAPEEKRLEMKEYSKDPLFTLKPETLELLTEPMFDEFLDTLFGNESRPERSDFIDKLSLDFAQYLLPSFLRTLILDKVQETPSNLNNL